MRLLNRGKMGGAMRRLLSVGACLVMVSAFPALSVADDDSPDPSSEPSLVERAERLGAERREPVCSRLGEMQRCWCSPAVGLMRRWRSCVALKTTRRGRTGGAAPT